MSIPSLGPEFKTADGRSFLHILLNTLLTSVINFTVWFAVTFWIYLETRSVFATGMISGIFLVSTALTGIWFGSLVDRHHKKTVMQVSAVVSFCLYAISFGVYLLVPAQMFHDPASPMLWVFVVLLMIGVISGNPRSIALPTLVTLLISEERRDRANGLVGTASGVSFLVTSVISGLLVAAAGMFWVLVVALVVLAASVVHLARVRLPERRVISADTGADPGLTDTGLVDTGLVDDGGEVDIKGTLRLIRGVPGLLALIVFSCLNNLLGGVFMALMDAYGLSLISVQAWGLLWGVMSTGFILGGIAVTKTGLTDNPVKVLLVVNLVLWSVTMLFPLVSSIVVLAVGMYAYMLLGPYAEAAEQTILQKVVPYERQGRVFGFAQSVEMAAAPLTAFLIGPITQFVFIPFMTDGAGAAAIGGWFGTGADRGIALVFVLTGALGLVLTALALGSPYYRRLSTRYRHASAPAPTGQPISNPAA